MTTTELHKYINEFVFNDNADLFGTSSFTRIDYIKFTDTNIPIYINEFWTSKQRQASSLHEISYRACFKPQLPAFFINLFTESNDFVYDPFSGRGTTAIEAGIRGRNAIANDVNPLSSLLSEPRFAIPDISDVANRLDLIKFNKSIKPSYDLSMFYHIDTEKELNSLRNYLIEKKENGREDKLDKWIRMVATNRLTGHSTGFFSVYTLPPNQAVSRESQIKINEKRNQKPEYKDVKKIVLKKTRSLIRNLTEHQISNLLNASKKSLFINKDARNTREIKSNSVKLTVTSPPFLDVVQYSKDNWLRCWFNNLDSKEIEKQITMSTTIEKWEEVMLAVFHELYRITCNDGWVAFEVGEVRNGKVKLDEHIAPIGIKAGFKCECILINEQIFTKTANIWGVKNNKGGTNTNRIVLFKKE